MKEAKKPKIPAAPPRRRNGSPQFKEDGDPETVAIKGGQIRARIDPELKADAEAILDQLGLNASDAIRIFYRQITLTQGLPFPVMIPNALTRQAMRDADAGEVTRYSNAAEMFEEMGI